MEVLSGRKRCHWGAEELEDRDRIQASSEAAGLSGASVIGLEEEELSACDVTNSGEEA